MSLCARVVRMSGHGGLTAGIVDATYRVAVSAKQMARSTSAPPSSPRRSKWTASSSDCPRSTTDSWPNTANSWTGARRTNSQLSCCHMFQASNPAHTLAPWPWRFMSPTNVARYCGVPIPVHRHQWRSHPTTHAIVLLSRNARGQAGPDIPPVGPHNERLQFGAS